MKVFHAIIASSAISLSAAAAEISSTSQLHPPKVECDAIAYHENFRGTEIDNDKPAVFATAWEAADGSRALMFANATPYEQNIAYRWKGAWTRTSMKPRELRLVPVSR